MSKLYLFKKISTHFVEVMREYHDSTEKRKECVRRNFNPLPFQRIFIMMFNELTAENATLKPVAWGIIETFGQMLVLTQPRRMPSFAYAWLAILGHRFDCRLLYNSVLEM